MEKHTKTIEQQVRERVAAEQENLKPEEKQEITSAFIRKCLQANELGDGVLYATLHRDRFIFVKTMELWLKWTGHHWDFDIMDEASAAVENVVAEYDLEAKRISDEIQKFQDEQDLELKKVKTKRLRKISAQIHKRIELLRSMRRRKNCLAFSHTCENPIAIHGLELDQKPWLLPCVNGVVDLKTGKLINGRPEDYMLKACPTEYLGIDAPRATWEKTLNEIFEDDDLLVSYIQRLFGLALVGSVHEHIFAVLTGPGGRNGKGTIVETISQVLGPLAGPIRSEMLIDSYQVQSSSGPTSDIMALRGLRLAWASETKEGVKISAAKVKWLTGGDRLTGRSPHDKSETNFQPTHTLFLLSNFKPAADANDKAFWERMQNIPFNVRFLKNREPSAKNERRADLFLKESLIQEASGILGWMVEGCLKWQIDGLRPPPKVVQETQDYMDEEDNFGAFIDHCLNRYENGSIGATELYETFEFWWTKYVGRFPWKQKKFGKNMRERFNCEKIGGLYRYYGVDLNDEWRGIMAEKRAK